MNSLLAITIGLLLVALTTGWQAIRLAASPISAQKIEETIPIFEARFSPKFIVDPESITNLRRDPELLDPSALLPQTHRFPHQQVQSLHQYSLDCKQIPRRPQNPSLQKAWRWEIAQCRNNTLPLKFFSEAPFVHPSGRTYASLALKARTAPKDPNKDQTTDSNSLFPYLHLLEIKDHKELTDALAPDHQHLASLNRPTLRALINQELLWTSEDFVYVAKQQPNRPNRYAVYSKSAWQKFFFELGYPTQLSKPDSYCLYQKGNLCWQLDPMRQRTQRQFYWCFLGSSGLMLIFLVGLLYDRALWKKRHHEKRKLMLQMLTHELRTPASVISLGVEKLRRDYDQLPEGSQHAFLRLAEECSRLQRVIEASRNYLTSEYTGQLQFQFTEVESLNNWVSDILQDYPDVQWSSPTEDGPFRLDPYWTAMCLRNLLHNASSHGKPPIELTLQRSRKCIRFALRDSGDLKLNLKQMTQPFNRSLDSKGMGLGLHLVSKITQSMGGRLFCKSHPTTFYMELRTPV